MSQSCVPAPPFGQRTTQAAPSAQVAWQGPLSQTNAQALPGPQAQVPFAQVPEQSGLSPSQVTWQGGAPQVKSQVEPAPQTHAPLAHAPSHEGLSPSQVRWQGGASQSRAHDAPASQTHAPSTQRSSSSGSSPHPPADAAAAASNPRTSTVDQRTARVYSVLVARVDGQLHGAMTAPAAASGNRLASQASTSSGWNSNGPIPPLYAIRPCSSMMYSRSGHPA